MNLSMPETTKHDYPEYPKHGDALLATHETILGEVSVVQYSTPGTLTAQLGSTAFAPAHYRANVSIELFEMALFYDLVERQRRN